MSGQTSDLVIIRNAGEDMSSEADYFRRFVRSNGADTENVIRATSPTQRDILGVLINHPGDDDAAQVCISGFCMARLGGTLEPNDYITSDTVGRAVKWTPDTGAEILGRYLPLPDTETPGGNGRDGASGDYGQILLMPVRPVSRPIYKTGTINFSTINSAGHATPFSDLTTALTGVATGDVVNANFASPPGGINFNAWVSATNVVTIRAKNSAPAAYNPAAVTYYLSVTPRVSHP